LVRLPSPCRPGGVGDGPRTSSLLATSGTQRLVVFLGSANALALPFARAILITENARTLFTSDEMKAVLTHELAHLAEDKITRLLRLLTPILYLPLIKLLIGFVGNPERGLPFLAWCPVIMAGFIFLNRRRRRMEVRADVFGSWLHADKSIYAGALAKLYQANEMPAVMPKKTHAASSSL